MTLWKVIFFVSPVHLNLNNIIWLVYFCASSWIIPFTIKQDNFIFRVQVIVYQLVDMFNKAIEGVFTAICNSFYKYTTVYGIFPSFRALVWNLYSFTKYVCQSFVLWIGPSAKFLKWSISGVGARTLDNLCLNHEGNWAWMTPDVDCTPVLWK